MTTIPYLYILKGDYTLKTEEDMNNEVLKEYTKRHIITNFKDKLVKELEIKLLATNSVIKKLSASAEDYDYICIREREILLEEIINLVKTL